MEFRKMVMIILYVRQQKRHRCIEQSLGGFFYAEQSSVKWYSGVRTSAGWCHRVHRVVLVPPNWQTHGTYWLAPNLQLIYVLFFFFLTAPSTCGILVAQPGTEPGPPLWKHRVLTTGLSRKSPRCFWNSAKKPVYLRYTMMG